jgi:hypothetical protein
VEDGGILDWQGWCWVRVIAMRHSATPMCGNLPKCREQGDNLGSCSSDVTQISESIVIEFTQSHWSPRF